MRPGSGPSAWLPLWLEFDLHIETGVDCTSRFLPLKPGTGTPRRYIKVGWWWGQCEGELVKPWDKLGLSLEHPFLMKEGNIFVLKKCDGVRCAEVSSFKDVIRNFKGSSCTQRVNSSTPHARYEARRKGSGTLPLWLC